MSYRQHVAKAVSEFLCDQLDMRGLTIRELSAQLEERGIPVTHKAISRWIRCETTPKSEYILGLADYFGTSTDEILGAYADEFYEEETDND